MKKNILILIMAPMLPVFIVWIAFLFGLAWGFDPEFNPLDWPEWGRAFGAIFSGLFASYAVAFVTFDNLGE